ncbi:hypothetical protein Cflav_PD3566 [Pedosphaera parvula Ellin514]|uniref:Uncharacterized protein n=1 Tax=Pedosphaera parvula (strain Ellin514) TaxID=320771 RepID=B9XH73_PEDPL|nr:hypothetical protein Cflav_PD3566 [Pedosphaera parvula Ellin514]
MRPNQVQQRAQLLTALRMNFLSRFFGPVQSKMSLPMTSFIFKGTFGDDYINGLHKQQVAHE